jgi:23S rRNA-/tRNA-specific pseudouridylate synthase
MGWPTTEGILPTGRNGEVRPGLVHRIDKDTSGLLVIGKSEYAKTHSNQLFPSYHRATYLALVWGVPTSYRAPFAPTSSAASKTARCRRFSRGRGGWAGARRNALPGAAVWQSGAGAM